MLYFHVIGGKGQLTNEKRSDAFEMTYWRSPDIIAFEASGLQKKTPCPPAKAIGVLLSVFSAAYVVQESERWK